MLIDRHHVVFISAVVAAYLRLPFQRNLSRGAKKRARRRWAKASETGSQTSASVCAAGMVVAPIPVSPAGPDLWWLISTLHDFAKAGAWLDGKSCTMLLMRACELGLLRQAHAAWKVR